jgi:hypothetical protein
VLGSYYLAGSFSRPSILLDPSGRLQALTNAVSKEYSRRQWVEKRCEHGWSNAAGTSGRSADILERARRVEASKSRIWAVAEAIMAATPEVRD